MPEGSVIWRAPGVPEQIQTDIRRVKASTRGPFGVNFVMGFPFDDNLTLALSENVPIVSFFWGDASAYVQQAKSGGAIAMQVVASVLDAKIAERAGFDIIVAQGREAGGHLMALEGMVSKNREMRGGYKRNLARRSK